MDANLSNLPFNFSFDFHDKYFNLGDLRFAFRLFTLKNTYSPDPQETTVQHSSHALIVKASSLACAGNQQKAKGSIEVRIEKKKHRIFWSASATHNSELIKGFGTLIRGIDIWQVVDDGTHEITFSSRYRRTYPLSRNIVYTVLGAGLPVPLIFVRSTRGTLYFALTKDTEVRGKTFCVYRDQLTGEAVLELHHEEDARRFSNSITVPPWHLGTTLDRGKPIQERMKDLEVNMGLEPLEKRRDVPDWFNNVHLVLNMHCEHWTGYVFNTFNRLLEILEWICERMDGENVLAYLPGWDGRYYFNYPLYEPSERCGGGEGLESLVKGAHKLGVHVVPMFGATGVNFENVRRLNLEDAILKDMYGNPLTGNLVDQDCDRQADGYWRFANLGHPGFRKHMYERICYLKDTFDVDGVFLDISGIWSNDPHFSPFEGTLKLIQDLHEKYDDFLVFGENWYDALLSCYALIHSQNPFYPRLFFRYCRMTHHLSFPAPGLGSTGVHELGFRSISGEQIQDPRFLPTLAIVDDTLPKYAKECERIIDLTKNRRY